MRHESEPGGNGDHGRLVDIVAGSREGIVVVDEAGTVVFANPAAETLLGRGDEGSIGYPLGVPTTAEVTELAIVRPGAEPVTVELRATETVWEGTPGFVVNLHDITERRRAEARARAALEELTATRNHLARAQSVAEVGSWRLDIARDVLVWSDEGCRIFGVEPGTERTYESFLAYVHPEDRDHVDRKWKAAVAGEPYDVEHRILVDGEVRWVRQKADMEVDEDGRVVAGVGTTQDVTERKAAAAGLDQARLHAERLNHILQAIQDINHVIWREPPGATARSRIIQKTCEILVEVPDFSACWIVLQEDGALLGAAHRAMGSEDYAELLAAFEADEPPDCCRRLSPEDPVRRSWIAEDCGDCHLSLRAGHETLTTGLYHDERCYGFLTVVLPSLEGGTEEALRLIRVIGEDLAYGMFTLRVAEDQKRTGRVLSETERIAEVGGWMWDLEADRFVVSEGWRRIHGAGDRELDLKQLLSFAVPEERAHWAAALERARDHGAAYAFEHRIRNRLTGEIRWVLARAEPARADEPGRVYGSTRDVTKQRRATEQIAFQARILTAVGEAVIVTDAAGAIVYWNDAATELYGWSADEVMGRPVVEVTPSPQMGEQAAEIMAALQRGERWSGEFPVRKRDGTLFPALVTNTPAFDDGGKLEAIIGISRDLTTMKAAESEVREANLRLDAAVHAGGIGLWDWDLETDETVYSAEWKRQIGHAEDEIGNDFEEWRSRVHPDDLADALDRVEAYRRSADEYYENEFRFRHRDGHYLHIFSRAAAIRDGDGRPVRILGSHVDITPLREAEEQRLVAEHQLARSQRLESIGRLAGGVAHDFNNALGVILGVADLALTQIDERDPYREDFAEIEEAARQAAGLTRQLLAFARQQAHKPRVLDLNEAVGSMLRMLRRLIGEDIALAWVPAEPISPVRMDPVQVEQVLINLVINARDAVGEAGTITIRTADASVDTVRHSPTGPVEPGPFVRLSVVDDGTGMDQETIDHVFEPFFTTKPAGVGTGLGLATVLGIVEQNGGFIEIDSRLGDGTTFHVWLPAARGATVAVDDGVADEPAVGGSETILVVEDEVALLRLLRRYLDKLGYSVLAASGPKAALELAARHGDTVSLLMTDVVMPEMNGRELYESLAGERPELRCLFMSGYTADVISERGVLPETVSFIEKPFTIAELAVRLREILDPG